MRNKLNLRKYGSPPYSVVVVHGGPSAPGELRLIAEELSKSYGVLEPLQTAGSVDGQIEELQRVIEENFTVPVYLIGWSWGAWLAYLLSAKYPRLVKKLILISSGPFEESYANSIMPTRLNRLLSEEKIKADEIIKTLQKHESDNIILKDFGTLMNKADSFDPIEDANNEESEFQPRVYEKAWGEADKLRSSGELLRIGKDISCPVVAIHGDYDPHPYLGVKDPLSNTLNNFRFILLEKCGHTPWKEKQARDKFYEILKAEIE